jgi:phosphoglycolate phosphatase-like HAD superfamily hydrolase
VKRVVPTLLIDLDGALGDTRPLWDAWLEDASRTLPAGTERLPADRAAAARALDDAGAGNWRTLLARYAEDRAPVYLRPDATTSAALRRLAADGVRLGAFTDAPIELARIALAQLGATRRLHAVTAGVDALERLRRELGDDAAVVSTREELAGYASEAPAAPAR